MAYLLDSDVFIQAKNLHYGFDFCPGFWTWLERATDAGSVLSVEKVGEELAAGNDELSAWADQRGPTFFVAPEPAVLPVLGRVATWANSNAYKASAVNTFLQVADYYLVAQALAAGHIVVTHEVPSGSKNKIKVPDACIALGVKCINPFEMLRRERARLVLGPANGG